MTEKRLTPLAVWGWLTILLAVAVHGQHEHGAHDHTAHDAAYGAGAEAQPTLFALGEIPDTPLVDQDGHAVRFRSDLVADQLVAINFIFTTCTTICPPQGAIFATLQRELAERPGQDVRFLSISIDPATDTPERLKAWAARFDAPPGWTLLTGEKPEVDHLLKKLGVFSALREDHAPIMLIGNDATGEWTRAYGLASPDVLADLVQGLRRPASTSTADQSSQVPEASAAREYFTDLELIDQDGHPHRFYSDLIEGRTVVINSFFADCADSCPLTHATMAKVQHMLAERLGQSVYLLSITVDPENDDPAKLADYARRFEARPGWFFLTGSKENVGQILGKLGHRVEQRESHKSIFLIGNDATGLWKKAFALAPASDILAIVRSVVEDAG